MKRTYERLSPQQVQSDSEKLMYLRHLFAYEFAASYLTSDSSVLDLGCGEGYGTSFLSKLVKEVVGVDVDSEIIQNAETKYGSSNCKFVHYKGGDLLMKDESFDVITSFQVIEHVIDVDLFIQDAWRMLHPGGVFILTTPNRTLRLFPGQKPWNKYHLREYYPHELKNILAKKFSSVTNFGIGATQEIMNIESERILRIQRKVNNPLRAIIPGGFNEQLGSMLKKISSQFKRNSEDRRIVIDFNKTPFFIVKDDIYYTLDLLMVCQK